MLQILKHSLFGDLAYGLYIVIKRITHKKRKLNPLYISTELYTELYTQCLNNVRYIQSSISVLSASANYTRGDNAGETRRKREGIRKQIDWYTEKLKEEKSMVKYYYQFANLD